MLLTSRVELSPNGSGQLLETVAIIPKPDLIRPAGDSSLTTGWSAAWQLPAEPALEDLVGPGLDSGPQTQLQEVDPLYLFSRHIEWEQREEPSAAWDLIGAAQSLNSDTPAHTRTLLASPNIWVELDSTPPLLARERSATQPWRPT